MIRYYFRFTGRVQGVGFRWTATRAADMLGLTGWVYNSWDGSVEMEVQGDEESIAEMIQTIDRGRFIQIDNIEKKTIPVVEDERYFDVK
ncbi:MAG: acylphosphatase [Lachnospiraceae bacterium]|nr:acylphosphatase [Lachnospiraceae bacterium]MBP3754573.1 acylphosphatase [Lachnospiraceae bacterium]